MTAKGRLQYHKKSFFYSFTNSSSVMREVEKLRECIGQIVDSPALEQFSSVWEEIGMEERHRTDRRTSILSHLQELLQDMVKEESELKEKLLKSVQACNEELDQLCQELSASEELVSCSKYTNTHYHTVP